MGEDQQISGKRQDASQISFEHIIQRCKVLKSAYQKWCMYCEKGQQLEPSHAPWQQPEPSHGLGQQLNHVPWQQPKPSYGQGQQPNHVPWQQPKPSHSLRELPKVPPRVPFNPNSQDAKYFLQMLACLYALSENRNYSYLKIHINSFFYFNQIKLPPLSTLTCKKIRSYLKCKCECGILSPLEFDHKKVSFSDIGKQKKEHYANPRYAPYTSLPCPLHFKEAVSQISATTEIPEEFAKICIFSALSSITQRQIQLYTPHKKPQAINFSPIFIVSSEEIRAVLSTALEKAYAPLYEYQESLPSDGVKTEIENKEIIKIRRQLHKIDIGSVAYEQLFKVLKKLENMPEKHNFCITKWTPTKFFKQLAKHPESCCILDTQGEFICSLLKNTRGIHEVIRFLATPQTSGTFRYEDEYERRHHIPKRGITITSIITRKEYDKLLGRQSRIFEILLKKIFPIYVDFEIQGEIHIAKPEPFINFKEHLSINNKYNEKIKTLIESIINKNTDIVLKNKYMFNDNMKYFNKGSEPEQLLLHNTIDVLMATYEKTLSTDFRELEYLPYINATAQHLLHSNEKAYQNSTENPVIKIVYRIKNFLMRNQLWYFRFRALQNKLFSKVDRELIQAAIDKMIDEGDIQVVEPNSPFSLETELSPKAGQLYAFNMGKAIADLKKLHEARYEETLPEEPTTESKQSISFVENMDTTDDLAMLSHPDESATGDIPEQSATECESEQEPQPAAYNAALEGIHYHEEFRAAVLRNQKSSTSSNTPEQSTTECKSEHSPQVDEFNSCTDQNSIENPSQSSPIEKEPLDEQTESNTNQQTPPASCESPLDPQASQTQSNSSAIANEAAPEQQIPGSTQHSLRTTPFIHSKQQVTVPTSKSALNHQVVRYKQNVAISTGQQVPFKEKNKFIRESAPSAQLEQGNFSKVVRYIEQVLIPSHQQLFKHQPIFFDQPTSYEQHVWIPANQLIPVKQAGTYKQVVHIAAGKHYIQQVTIPVIDYPAP